MAAEESRPGFPPSEEGAPVEGDQGEGAGETGADEDGKSASEESDEDQYLGVFGHDVEPPPMPVRKSVFMKAGETYQPDEPDSPAEAVFPLGWDIPLQAVPVPVYR